MLHTEYFTQIPATLTFLLVALVDCSGCLIALGMKVTHKTVKPRYKTVKAKQSGP